MPRQKSRIPISTVVILIATVLLLSGLSGLYVHFLSDNLAGETYVYLQEIAQYTGWEYEFVQVPGGIDESLTEMLRFRICPFLSAVIRIPLRNLYCKICGRLPQTMILSGWGLLNWTAAL